jgi:dTDP-glucose 4,6-dehydratase
MERSRVLVTGGVGFLGTHLCRELLQRGHRVTCFDVLDPGIVNPATLDAVLGRPGFEFVQGDVRDLAAVRRCMSGHDYVIHSAAVSSVDRSLALPYDAIEVNVMGTLNVLTAAHECGVRRVHYMSTDEVWGQIGQGAFTEQSPIQPRNPYAAGKAGGEAAVLAWGNSFGLDVTITNACNTYGPYQKPDKLIPRSVVRVLRGEPIMVYGDGQHEREWIHVDDHVAAVLLVLDEGLPGERYGVGTGERYRNIEVVKLILDEFGSVDGRRFAHQDDRVGHDRRYALDSAKLRALGWEPARNFDKGLHQTIEWYKANDTWWRHFFPE